MLFKYIAFHYLKNMLIILMGLTGLFAGLDFLMNGSSLPSFNIKVLYIFNKWQESLNLLYPLAIIFGGIWTKIIFIKRNTMGAIYALGVSRVEVFRPFLFISLATYLLFVGLNFTSFAIAQDTAKALHKNEYNIKRSEDLFFKYNNSFVYIGSLLPYEKRLENLTIFELEDDKVIRVLSANSASYHDSEWLAESVTQKSKAIDIDGNPILKIEQIERLNTLKGYHPKILNSIYEDKQLTLYESLIAKKLLTTQGVGTYKVRSDIYGKTVLPLFSIALLMILIFRFPFHARYMNLGGTTIKALGGTLFTWGGLFALQQMGATAVIIPELATILPISLLWVYAIYTLGKAKKRI
ncbi:YjgP/YjgQ family permease [Sulfurovum sp. bin170]|uniref:LptF/LptG family permease n=1 Tax=Sulfurovum sp. bin170 TaxID=2695268 RepID=UPI0013DF09F1|nr:LptF/LptG family permease [Sulfurovum sp. bin170]NEW61269.1 YjgP/YjgQ family permease [Sulfurovum sp. bin170]